MTSAAPAIKAALFDGLTALFAADVTVGVTYGPPARSPLQQTTVIVGNVVTEVTFPRGGSNRTRDEVHTVTVTVRVSSPGNAPVQQTCTERAYDVLADVDVWLRAFAGENLALSSAGVYLALVGGHELLEDDDPERLAVGRTADLSVKVEVWARRV